MHIAPLVETMTNGGWTIGPLPLGPPADDQYTDVTRTALDACAAMGQDDDGPTLATLSDGECGICPLPARCAARRTTAWSPGVRLGRPLSGRGELPARHPCRGVLESYDGTSWTPHLITNPFGAGGNEPAARRRLL